MQPREESGSLQAPKSSLQVPEPAALLPLQLVRVNGGTFTSIGGDVINFHVYHQDRWLIVLSVIALLFSCISMFLMVVYGGTVISVLDRKGMPCR